jgi:hypothetical protein
MQCNGNVVINKGFYLSVKPAIMKTHCNIHGNFIISLDYLSNVGIQKKILTTRLIITNKYLESSLNGLFDIYGNFHLNYIIYIKSVLIEEKQMVMLKTQFNKLDIDANCSSWGIDVIFDRQKLYSEFHMFKQLFKSRTFKDDKIEILFVNENIKPIYMETGMNKI